MIIRAVGQQMNVVLGVLATAFLFPALLFSPVSAEAAAPACSTAACHPALGRGKSVHNPVASGECSMCHEATGRPHPAEKGGFRFTESGGKLCRQCHDAPPAKDFVHSPVATGECLACHDPHASANTKLLRKRGGELCALCHDSMAGKKHVHGPVEMGDCLSCHDPHHSPNRHLLRKHGSDLCVTCHVEVDKQLKESKDVHAPLAAGDCTSCHDPHRSDYGRLLKKNYPFGLYAEFTPAAYELCFTCHKVETVTDPKSSVVTSFRDGDRNLHYVHVIKLAKGRSCNACHHPHASKQDRLIKEKVEGFGDWTIPVRYTLTPDGGTCVAGCHKPRSYRR